MRILKSYFDMLQQLRMHSHMTELINCGPQGIVWIKEIEKKNPMITLLCPYCRSEEAK